MTTPRTPNRERREAPPRDAGARSGRLRLLRRRPLESAPPALVAPAGRQGPGHVPSALIEALDLAFVRRSGGVLAGEHRAMGVGTGTELAQLRAYQPGDDVRQLDPAATARTGVPHVRQQVPERLLTTWIALDLSPSMAFGTADRLKSDVAEGVADVLGSLAIKRGGKIGLMTFGAPTRRLIPPHGGRGALVQLRHALAEGVAPDGAAGEPLERAAVRLGRLARQPGLVIVISDFGGSPEPWARPLAALGARHSLLAVEVRDPREVELPAVGRLALVDPETGERVEVDTSSRELRRRYRAARAEERDAVARVLRRAGAEHVVVSTEGSWSKALGRRLA
ncbi:MAG TPA: DUF58 domain-containing protein [Thermoleophilaceae bacterium]